MANDTDDNFKNPFGVTADEEAPQDFVRVILVVQGLKKKLFGSEASNGKVKVDAQPRSLSIELHMTTGKQDKYRYSVKKLPDEIIPEKCYHKVKKDQLIVYLCKAKSRSWSRELSESGLEQYDDEDEAGENEDQGDLK